jgi:hypothetical protein
MYLTVFSSTEFVLFVIKEFLSGLGHTNGLIAACYLIIYSGDQVQGYAYFVAFYSGILSLMCIATLAGTMIKFRHVPDQVPPLEGRNPAEGQP